MKFNANIDLRNDKPDSIGILRSGTGFNLSIMKNDMDLSIKLSKTQLIKIKKFLDQQDGFTDVDNNNN